eukprot:974833-Prymnesium_polylepis.1
MEWPSNLLLSALVISCKKVKLILAQSVGYKYTMSQGVITVSADDSKGRKFWSKRLLFGKIAHYIASQISATADNDVQGGKLACMTVARSCECLCDGLP